MEAEEVGRRLVGLLADEAAVAGVSGGQAYARATVDVPRTRWRDALRAARDDTDLACDFFDWLSAVDELDGGFDVVAHLWSTTLRHGLLLRTRVSREAAEVPSVVDVYPGAAWHERETYEMFGIRFAGHEPLRPLLLPPQFEGHPLRKEFVLASRVAKPWPGAKEPGESEAGGGRRPIRPPGVPAPGEWGTTPTPAGAGGVGEGPRGGTPARPARRPPGDRPPRAERPQRPGPTAGPAEEAPVRPPTPEGPAPSPKSGVPAPSPTPGVPAPSPTPGVPAPSPTPGDPTPAPTPDDRAERGDGRPAPTDGGTV